MHFGMKKISNAEIRRLDVFLHNEMMDGYCDHLWGWQLFGLWEYFCNEFIICCHSPPFECTWKTFSNLKDTLCPYASMAFWIISTVCVCVCVLLFFLVFPHFYTFCFLPVALFVWMRVCLLSPPAISISLAPHLFTIKFGKLVDWRTFHLSSSCSHRISGFVHSVGDGENRSTKTDTELDQEKKICEEDLSEWLGSPIPFLP